MTHDSAPPPHPLSNRRSLDGIADPSDLMRQLSDLFTLAFGCRRPACRRAGRCRGGEGPPCFHEHRELFVEAMLGGLRETRRFWKRQRGLAAAAAPGAPAPPAPLNVAVPRPPFPGRLERSAAEWKAIRDPAQRSCEAPPPPHLPSKHAPLRG